VKQKKPKRLDRAKLRLRAWRIARREFSSQANMFNFSIASDGLGDQRAFYAAAWVDGYRAAWRDRRKA
jgi:hypothetical protein